ncbi:hypothetical protein [uncultured Herbaspirillum sp.]|uniref:hypothetical protein n=1 Tax=uncultured Herbaspirillum sp. TaxID=160236 RepID=UPI00261BC22F|nr:hypothetical protein [uncultured Herbaspirillum sp.]
MSANPASGRPMPADSIPVSRKILSDLRGQIAEVHIALDSLAILLRRSQDNVEHGSGILLGMLVEKLEKADSDLTQLALSG